MRKLLSVGTLGLAGVVGMGLLTLPGTTLAAGSANDHGQDNAFVKRDDHGSGLVLASSDDDDDDTGDNTQTRTRSHNSRHSKHSKATRHSKHSRISHDNTRSNVTAMSRDRDHSRGDKTRDWTRDGGQHTRDLTANLTNDRSRNDTRGRG